MVSRISKLVLCGIATICASYVLLYASLRVTMTMAVILTMITYIAIYVLLFLTAAALALLYLKRQFKKAETVLEEMAKEVRELVEKDIDSLIKESFKNMENENE